MAVLFPAEIHMNASRLALTDHNAALGCKNLDAGVVEKGVDICGLRGGGVPRARLVLVRVHVATLTQAACLARKKEAPKCNFFLVP